ncbi:uncharacterized protein LOC131675808 [Topomyia yanbarensis]|uniref:uncharacterized protein LOC131675808 n=1 Tax=Topomyia yanbarensis TaxID=2498891 RepID=UPI00273A8A92|nr:uncharacterized protein LOC131675808 [Topomyia yanbarensis]
MTPMCNSHTALFISHRFYEREEGERTKSHARRSKRRTKLNPTPIRRRKEERSIDKPFPSATGKPSQLFRPIKASAATTTAGQKPARPIDVIAHHRPSSQQNDRQQQKPTAAELEQKVEKQQQQQQLQQQPEQSGMNNTPQKPKVVAAFAGGGAPQVLLSAVNEYDTATRRVDVAERALASAKTTIVLAPPKQGKEKQIGVDNTPGSVTPKRTRSSPGDGRPGGPKKETLEDAVAVAEEKDDTQQGDSWSTVQQQREQPSESIRSTSGNKPTERQGKLGFQVCTPKPSVTQEDQQSGLPKVTKLRQKNEELYAFVKSKGNVHGHIKDLVITIKSAVAAAECEHMALLERAENAENALKSTAIEEAEAYETPKGGRDSRSVKRIRETPGEEEEPKKSRKAIGQQEIVNQINQSMANMSISPDGSNIGRKSTVSSSQNDDNAFVTPATKPKQSRIGCHSTVTEPDTEASSKAAATVFRTSCHLPQ